MEKHYTFLVANRVENTLVFAKANNTLAEQICTKHNYDGFIWLNEDPTPIRWSTYDPKTNEFTPPTEDYLISIGVVDSEEETPQKTVK